MLHEFDDSILTKNNGVKMKRAAHELCREDVNLNDFYLEYNLHQKSCKGLATTKMANHCVNWLYTVRCECGYGGIKYINIVLKALKDTMHRHLDEMQYAFCKIIFDMYIDLRNLYK